MENFLIEISSPKSEKFRKYLKSSEIKNIVGRSNDEIDQLSQLIGSSVLTNSHNDWAFVTLSVEQIEKLFNCKLVTYVNTITSEIKVIASEGKYTIPENLRHIVQLVAGLNTFSSAHWSTPVMEDNAVTTSPVTPQTIYDNYQVPISGSHGNKYGSQAVVEFGNFANFNDKDLQGFFSKYQPSLTGNAILFIHRLLLKQ